jgi:hypothetical protein
MYEFMHSCQRESDKDITIGMTNIAEGYKIQHSAGAHRGM